MNSCHDVRIVLQVWYVDRGWRHATIETRVYGLRSRSVSLCTFPLTEDEKLSWGETLGLWVRLISLGWRIPWDDQWVLTGISNDEEARELRSVHEPTYIITAVCRVDRVIRVTVVRCRLRECSYDPSSREHIRRGGSV